MKNLLEYLPQQLEDEFKKINQPAYRSRQILSWIYQKNIFNFSQMSDLSEELRRDLECKFSILPFALAKKEVSSDDLTAKYLFKLEDANFIESVLIPAYQRNTACLSTQIGCRFACRFCASGLLGFKRNLTAGEIVAQALFIKKDISPQRISNLVIMGMGEPMDNYDNLLKAVRVFNSPQCFNIGARKITISTNGIIPSIERLAKEDLQIELSISLHAASDSLRSQLMPINKKYPLKQLILAAKEYSKKTKRLITFEYILIGAVNDSEEDALSLVNLLKGMDCKVNLIPYNQVRELDFTAPSGKSIMRFIRILEKNKLNFTLRKERGQEISSACGQLRLKTLTEA